MIVYKPLLLSYTYQTSIYFFMLVNRQGEREDRLQRRESPSHWKSEKTHTLKLILVYTVHVFSLSRVKVQAYSNVSGSPVDEKMLLQVRDDSLSALFLAKCGCLCPVVAVTQ